MDLAITKLQHELYLAPSSAIWESHADYPTGRINAIHFQFHPTLSPLPPIPTLSSPPQLNTPEFPESLSLPPSIESSLQYLPIERISTTSKEQWLQMNSKPTVQPLMI